jgi:hypothetical protein
MEVTHRGTKAGHPVRNHFTAAASGCGQCAKANSGRGVLAVAGGFLWDRINKMNKILIIL